MGKINAWTYIVPVIMFLAYGAWMLGPYLSSVIVRDAAVTTWARAAVAPIDGRIVTNLPEAGSVLGEDGQVATIRNQVLLGETRAVEDTRDRVVLGQTRIAEAEEYLADLEELERQRVITRERHAEVFHAQLETELANLRREIAVGAKRIALLERIAARQQALVDRGSGSDAALDEALLRLAEMTSRQTDLEASLSYALLRDRSAEDGYFITPDGGTPDWVREGELELHLELRRARHELHSAEAVHAEALRDLELEQETLAELAEATVTAPPGSVVFSVVATPGATVAAGTRIIEWIACTELMVDVPVSDAELPLILQGGQCRGRARGGAEGPHRGRASDPRVGGDPRPHRSHRGRQGSR